MLVMLAGYAVSATVWLCCLAVSRPPQEILHPGAHTNQKTLKNKGHTWSVNDKFTLTDWNPNKETKT